MFLTSLPDEVIVRVSLLLDAPSFLSLASSSARLHSLLSKNKDRFFTFALLRDFGIDSSQVKGGQRNPKRLYMMMEKGLRFAIGRASQEREQFRRRGQIILNMN
jgi:hypothetical protein